MKILVIQKKRIGDVLTSTILFEALKEKYPQNELHYLIYSNSLAVVENNPLIDKVVILHDETKKSTLRFLSFLFKIRKEKYDIVVDAYSKPNSILIGVFSGAKIKIAFKKIYSQLFYSHPTNRNKESFSNATKAIEHRMLLLKPLGIDFMVYKPQISLTEVEKKDVHDYLLDNNLDFNKLIVMISTVGSRDFKTYPFGYMAKALNIPAFTMFSPEVSKLDRNMFENKTTNIPVHLHDYLPHEGSYDKFEPILFETQLQSFLNHNYSR